MKVLIITRKNREPDETVLMEAARKAIVEAAGGRDTVKLDQDLDWNKLREVGEGYSGAYRIAAQSFDRIVVVPMGGAFIGRGQCSIIENALGMGKPVIMWSIAGGCPVYGIEVVEGGNWKTNYARLVG